MNFKNYYKMQKKGLLYGVGKYDTLECKDTFLKLETLK